MNLNNFLIFQIIKLFRWYSGKIYTDSNTLRSSSSSSFTTTSGPTFPATVTTAAPASFDGPENLFYPDKPVYPSQKSPTIFFQGTTPLPPNQVINKTKKVLVTTLWGRVKIQEKLKNWSSNIENLNLENNRRLKSVVIVLKCNVK